MLERIRKSTSFLSSKMKHPPEIGMITGTGLGSLTDQIQVETRIPYEAIPNFPQSTVRGHKGSLVTGTLSGKTVLAMEGRFHLYEGYSPLEVTFPVRVMSMLGVKYLLVSSAAGGLNPQFRKGELMVVTDHLNLTGTNPLMGPNLDDMGSRFPDMTAAYTPDLVDLGLEKALQMGIPLRRGVYAGLTGPSMETPAETRYLKRIGADAVGMSTVLETIVGVHCGLKVMAIVVLTNMNLPDCMAETSLEAVIETAKTSGEALSRLWGGIIGELPIQPAGPASGRT